MLFPATINVNGSLFKSKREDKKTAKWHGSHTMTLCRVMLYQTRKIYNAIKQWNRKNGLWQPNFLANFLGGLTLSFMAAINFANTKQTLALSLSL